jgi:hypothetical protein
MFSTPLSHLNFLKILSIMYTRKRESKLFLLTMISNTMKYITYSLSRSVSREQYKSLSKVGYASSASGTTANSVRSAIYCGGKRKTLWNLLCSLIWSLLIWSPSFYLSILLNVVFLCSSLRIFIYFSLFYYYF